MILTPLLKLSKNGEDWGKLIVAKGFKKLPKIQNIAQSGHTGCSQVFFAKVHLKIKVLDKRRYCTYLATILSFYQWFTSIFCSRNCGNSSGKRSPERRGARRRRQHREVQVRRWTLTILETLTVLRLSVTLTTTSRLFQTLKTTPVTTFTRFKAF